ncbi:unnamed protein product, partial [Caretta caretta]
MLPKPTVTPNQAQVLENGTFTLTCNSSPHADTLLWLRDGASLAPSDRLGLSPDNRTLTVLGVTRADAGAYQCEVRNPVSTERSEPSTVTVAYGPDSTRIDPPGPINVTFGSPLTLTCVTDSVPAPSYRWVLNGTDMKETGTNLSFSPTTWAQHGTYECRVHNPVTSRTAWASVAVRVMGAHSGLSAGAIAGIVIGSLVGMALVGVGVYFLYSCCRNETPRENKAPVPVYENPPPTAGARPVAQPGKPPDPSPIYETLEPGQQDVYEELKKTQRDGRADTDVTPPPRVCVCPPAPPAGRDGPCCGGGVGVSGARMAAPPRPRVWVGAGEAGRAVRKGGARCQRGRTPCPIPGLGGAREVLRAGSALSRFPRLCPLPPAGNQASLPSRRVPQQRRAMGRIPHRPGGPWTGILLA